MRKNQEYVRKIEEELIDAILIERKRDGFTSLPEIRRAIDGDNRRSVTLTQIAEKLGIADNLPRKRRLETTVLGMARISSLCRLLVEPPDKQMVVDYVWQNWQPLKEMHPVVEVKKLTAKVLDLVRVKKSGEFEAEQKEPTYFDEFLFRKRMENELSEVRFVWKFGSPWQVDIGKGGEERQFLGKMVSERDEIEILAGINNLDNIWQTVVILRALGLLEPKTSLARLGNKLGVERTLIFQAFKPAAAKLREIMTNNGVRGLATKTELWWSLVKRVEEERVVKSGGKSLTKKSVRLRFINTVNNLSDDDLKKRWAMLTMAEKRIAVKAFDMNGEDAFAFSVTRIAANLGINDSRIYHVLEEIIGLLSGEKTRFINKNGQPMLNREYPAPILELAKNFKDKYLEMLPPLQQEIFKYVVKGDERGFYPSFEELDEKFGRSSKNFYIYIKSMVARMKAIINREEVENSTSPSSG